MQRATIIALVLAAVGCGDVVRAPITVVVDTDRARHLEEQGRLQELRVGVQGDRIELERARADLQQARRRLEDSAVDPAGRAAAAAEVKALAVRLGSAPLSSSSLSREEFELALVASEQRVTASLAAEMGRLLAGQGTAPATQTTTSVPAVLPWPWRSTTPASSVRRNSSRLSPAPSWAYLRFNMARLMEAGPRFSVVNACSRGRVSSGRSKTPSTWRAKRWALSRLTADWLIRLRPWTERITLFSR